MTVASNVAARNAHTASISGIDPTVTMNAVEAEKTLFGWVYKQPWMPTTADCQRILGEVRSTLGDSVANRLLKKHHSKAVTDIWPGGWEPFFKDAEALLEKGESL